jgi:hypothetical protein
MGGISEGDWAEENEREFRRSAGIMNKLRDLGLRSSAEAPATWFCVNGTKEGPFLVEAYTDEAGTKNVPGALVAMSIINDPNDVSAAPRFSTGDPQDPQKWQVSILPDKLNEAALDRWVASVPLHAANNSAVSASPPQVGELDDGGIYVGLSAENGKPLHAALADLPDYKTYEEALAAAEQLKSLHPTAHVPTPKELDKNLFDNRNTGHLKGTFNTSGSNPGSVYRSSASSHYLGARVQWFGDGGQDYDDRVNRLPVRLVW